MSFENNFENSINKKELLEISPPIDLNEV